MALWGTSDYLAGLEKDAGWDLQPQCLCGFEIHYELELICLFDWARLILVVAAASTLTVVPVAHAQPAGKVPRVGYFAAYSASDPEFQHSRDIFRQALRELGYVEGQNIAVEYRWAEGKNERPSRLSSELVHAKVDVIVVIGGLPSARAAQQATRTIPIVIAGAVDPVGTGLVASLARPGGN